MDRDGVETGPEVKVPIYTYRKLASKLHLNSDKIKISYQIFWFLYLEFHISFLQTPLKEFSTPELQNLIEKVEKLYDG